MTTETKTTVISAPTASIFDLFETDQDMQKNGVWVTFGKYGKIKLAYAGEGNPRYMKAMEAAFREHRQVMKLNAMDDSAVRDIFIKVVADTVALDWDFLDKARQPIPFSPAKASEVFKKLPPLFDSVREKAADWQNFRAASLDTDAGN